MDIYQWIDSLILYGKRNHLIVDLDTYYYINAYLALFHLNDYKQPNEHIDLPLPTILQELIQYAIQEKIIDNTFESKDLFDTKIMGIMTPKPSEVIKRFYQVLQENDSSEVSTQYFYNLCKNVNYIRCDRISKDIHFNYKSEYGTMNISINMSKPEKDPNDIKKLLKTLPSNYPKCMLCIENENYSGRIGYPARENLRCIPITLHQEPYYIQFSPYSYYEEHLICFHKKHFNMRINENTMDELLDFVSLFPHYFIGSNADLPIVGGSILNHQHFQGGKAILPMANATKVFIKESNQVKFYKLKWPLSVIRLVADEKSSLLTEAKKILYKWRHYRNEALWIINEDENGIHNTITPIVRKNQNDYEMDLVLRNNFTTLSRPLGCFHPQEKYWHIKKENIGLIEVMGLAILPSRLKKEMLILEKYLLNESLTEEERNQIEKHLDWANERFDKKKINKENVNKLIEDGIGEVYVNVLRDCAVFKDDHQEEFDNFIMNI